MNGSSAKGRPKQGEWSKCEKTRKMRCQPDKAAEGSKLTRTGVCIFGGSWDCARGDTFNRMQRGKYQKCEVAGAIAVGGKKDTSGPDLSITICILIFLPIEARLDE